MKRPRRREGDLVAIDLGDGTLAFGRVLKEPLLAFYDLRVRNEEIPALSEILTRPVLWRIWVMNHAITRGRWKVLGHVPLEEPLKRCAFQPDGRRHYFIQGTSDRVMPRALSWTVEKPRGEAS